MAHTEPPVLDAETILAAVRECVTVVKPGETLIVRARDSWTPEQMRYLQEMIDFRREHDGIGCHVLVVPGAEFAVTDTRSEEDRDADLLARLKRIWPQIQHWLLARDHRDALRFDDRV